MTGVMEVTREGRAEIEGGNEVDPEGDERRGGNCEAFRIKVTMIVSQKDRRARSLLILE